MKRFILWDFPRASWQYDVMVGIILAFIFLTPRGWFRDQPRAGSVVLLPAGHGSSAFWIEPELLAGVPESNRLAVATQLAKAKLPAAKKYAITRVEPIFDAEEEIRGYMVFATPTP
jgi:hypothetical protein